MSRLRLLYVAVLAGLLCTATACQRGDDQPPPLPRSAAVSDSVPGPAPGTSAGAAGVSGESALSGGPVAGADRLFMAEAANNNLAEIEAGRLVAGRTGDNAVRSFALQMERDHVGAHDELKRLASQKSVDLPNAVEGKARGQLNQLNSLSPPELESIFLRDFGIDAHQKAIGLFERQAREGQDPELKAFAERTLARLREHLALAQQMQGGQAGRAGGR